MISISHYQIIIWKTLWLG